MAEKFPNFILFFKHSVDSSHYRPFQRPIIPSLAPPLKPLKYQFSQKMLCQL